MCLRRCVWPEDDPIIFFTSTNKVYGNMADVAVVEGARRFSYADAPHGIAEDRPLDLYSPYGCSKGAGRSIHA